MLSATTAQILRQLTLRTPTQKPDLLFCVYVPGLSQCVSSQASGRNMITGNRKKKNIRKKKISLHTQKAKTVIWQWLQESLSPVPISHAGYVCACAHMCIGERAREPRNTRIYMGFFSKPGYKKQVKSQKAVVQQSVFWAETIHPHTHTRVM